MKDRREYVSFDAHFFEKQTRRGFRLSLDETFLRVYETNDWGAADSVSGDGESRSETRRIEALLPGLLRGLRTEVLLDLPCGDFSRMQRVALPISRYVGADLVPEIIETNRQRFECDSRRFVVLDLTTDELPQADVLLCRDCLVHLSFDDALKAIRNVRRSRIRYLLATTFPGCDRNEDVTTGDWRPINLERAPFHFPPPLGLLNEGCREAEGQFADKSLGVWRVPALPGRTLVRVAGKWA
jgi:hypothetical protein